MIQILAITAVTFAGIAYPLRAQTKAEKEAAASKYKDKFLVVRKEGLYLGVAGNGMCQPSLSGPRVLAPRHASVTIAIDDADHVKAIEDPFKCGTEPIHKGEVLKVYDVGVHTAGRGTQKAPYLFLLVVNVSPHAITRGIGAFEHQSMERGATEMAIRAGSEKDFNADSLTDQWFMLFDSEGAVQAARIGNTETGVFVNQVKLGMSFAEVEAALGVPQTRADLGKKVLYKYKDMTVEFHDGKVSDVR